MNTGKTRFFFFHAAAQRGPSGRGARRAEGGRIGKPAVLALAVLLSAALLSMPGCATTEKAAALPREPLNLTPQQPVRTYRIAITYTNQDEIGIPTDILEIRALVVTGTYQGKTYCRWEEYEQREYRASQDPPEWSQYPPASGFDYLITPVAEEPDYLPNLPPTDSLPRTLVGFYFYINLIDFHMWDLYINMFLDTPRLFPEIAAEPLREVGDTMTVNLTDLPIALLEWENVSSDLEMTAGIITAEYLGTGSVRGVPTRIIAFGQQQTLRQTIYGLGFSMPYDGTNRFSGHMHLDADGRLLLASYREFVYGRVKAPMSQIVIVHSQRDYRIELVSEEP